jgi:hypothetical protein
MYSRVVGENKSGRVITRSTRLISGHAYNVAVSGTLSAMAAEQYMDCQHLGVPFDNAAADPEAVAAGEFAGTGGEGDTSTKGDAMLVPFSSGAKLIVEQALSAWFQEVLTKARDMRDLVGDHKRLSKVDISEAFASHAGRAFAPQCAVEDVIVCPVWKTKSKSKSKSRGDSECDNTTVENATAMLVENA